MPKKRDKQNLGDCRIEVYENEENKTCLAVVGLDFTGQEIIRLGLPVPIAKEVAYALLKLVYRLENGQPIIGDESPNDDHEPDADPDGDPEA